MSPASDTHPEPSNGSLVSTEGAEGTCELCRDLPHRQFTHCIFCHASWTRTSKTAHCMTCHRTFSTPTAFDRHLLPVGCTDPAGKTKRNGERVFGDPRANVAGTLVWRLAGQPPEREPRRPPP